MAPSSSQNTITKFPNRDNLFNKTVAYPTKDQQENSKERALDLELDPSTAMLSPERRHLGETLDGPTKDNDQPTFKPNKELDPQYLNDGLAVLSYV